MSKNTKSPDSLCRAALDVLNSSGAKTKAEKTRSHTQNWQEGALKTLGTATPPDRPARPERPELKHPFDMPPRGKGGSLKGKIALLHALAHIELNAIDLAWDIIARFSNLAEENTNQANSFTLPLQFYEDWLKVADDEAKHFLMLEQRLNDFDATYGDLPAHDGLWESAEATAHDFAARLAIVPMVLEARGLDVTPKMIENMKAQNDEETAAMLKIIHDDEITHVRAGTVWFESWCKFHDYNPQDHWQTLVKTYFNGPLRKPFNHPSRHEAGMIRDWYEPLADIEWKAKSLN